MSFRLVAHTPTVGAAPGESVIGRVEVFNDGSTDAVYTVVVVGLTADPLTEVAEPPPARVVVPAGSSVVTEVVVAVPRTLGIGQHAAAFEGTSSRSSDRAVLTPFTVSIQSVSRVELVPQPSTIRARRKASFHLDVTNNEALPVEIALTGEAPDVDVSFTPPAMSLQPGQRVVAKARVKGPRHWSGERTQHNILITARGRASSTSTTAAYVQRPLFAHRFRMVVAGLTVVALWLAAIGGAALWLSNRDEGGDAANELVGVDTDGDGVPDVFYDAEGNPVTATDTDGDGIPDTFVDADGNPIPGTDTDGDGIPDTLVDADGKPLEAIDTNGDGKPDTLSNGAPLPAPDEAATVPEPQTTILRGTVEIDGDPSTVAVALTPIALGGSPSPEAAPIGIKAAQPSEPEGKIWSARTTTLNDIVGSPTRRTVAIEPDSAVPGADGVWLFTDVLQGQSYEVSFSSPGYDTQSFVLTPRADGEPIDLDVKMKPAKGSLSGAVVGPSGPLGGAEVTITDGTLEFVTTSASGSGTWSLQDVSTPGVYTVTASLRGYATAVRQVRLAPGDTPTGITLQMAPGLGTITGLITTNGVGLGGVTVTASNGETTLTTTSLTEGNIGFYSLPQLAVPADYTVQAELDGYVTNSRRVPLNGSQSGVDFSMASTTSRLTGRILSSAGGGIEAAGLIVSTGELQFRSSTSPNGAFEIDRLPPGDYTITVEHYLHESTTELTTLTAGQNTVPLEITLPLSTGPPEVGTGSLVVEVVNDDPKIDPPGIKNAKVTLSRNRTSQTWTLQDPDSSAVTFDELPIGTYTVNVRADGYNLSAPVTQSVGQARERAEIELQRLGQASGSMVNSLDPTNTPLPGYSVTLYRLANINDPVGIAIDTFSDTAGTWTTPDTALPTGLYRIEATSPLGFYVRNDQVLDTAPQVAGRKMTFLVPQITDAEVKPIIVPPIEADPYPTITGKIYMPRLNGVTVEYDAIDDAALAVSGSCNGTDVSAKIAITDEFGSSNPSDTLYDTFSIAKEAIATAIPTTELPGNCEFTVTAPGRVATTIDLANVVASDGLTPSDRLAAAALVKTPAAFGGTVFWFDKGTNPDERVALEAVAITSAAPVITGFEATEASSTTPDPRPIATLGALSTTSSATGTWTLNGQVFGTSSYVFTTPNFTPGSIPVTINENARVVPATGTNANVFTDAGDKFGIELTPPNPGTVSGTVTIQTTSTPKYGTDMVRGTDPSSATRTATPSATGDFSFAAAIAGTWLIEFVTPANHVLTSNLGATPPGSVSGRLLPGGSLSGFDARFTELGRLTVRLFDKTTNAAITPPAGLDLTDPGTPTLTGTVTDRAVGPPDTANEYTLDEIPVAAIDPTNTSVVYPLALRLDNFDLSQARTGPLTTDPIVDARNLTFEAFAGTDTTIDLYVDSFKSITGRIQGLQTVGSPVDLPLSGPADLVVTRDGAQPGDPTPQVVGNPDGTFVITGLPGTYRITPSHPEYQTFPEQVVALGSSANVVLPAAFQLTLNQSELSVDALTQLTGGTAVAGAVFDRYLGTAPCTSFPATPTSVDIPETDAAVIDLAPGDYCLRISKFDSAARTKEIAFPAIVQVTVPTSITGATQRRATVVAPLPALRPTLTGKLIAQNSAGGTVELVASPAPQLTSAFTQNVDVSVNGSTTTNLNPNSTGSRTATAVAPTPPTAPAEQTDFAWTYQFTDIPYGSNEITAPPITGYAPTTATTKTVAVSEFGPTTVPDFVYTRANGGVEFVLPPGVYPSLDPAFTATDNRATVNLAKTTDGLSINRSYTFDAATRTLVVNDIAPEVGNWTLRFDDALHTKFDDDKVKISKSPNAQGRYVGTLNDTVTANLVRLTGLATQRAGADPGVALTGDAVLTLAGPSTYTLPATPPPPPPTPPPPDSPRTTLVGTTYLFDVPAAVGTYTLTGTKSEFLTRQLVGLGLTTAGTVLGGQNIEIQKEATVSVTVGNRSLSLPSDLRVDLLNTDNNSTYGPISLSGSPLTATFKVPAGTYRARTVSATYPQQTSTPDTAVPVGGTTSLNITLPRVTRFTITGPSSATVAITGLTSQSGATVEFSETTTTGAVDATVSATGYRTKVVPVAANLLTENPVTLLPNVTVTGTIDVDNEALGNVLTATDGTTTLQGSIDADTYSVAGLTANADGTAKSWTVNYVKPGVGTGSSTAISVSAIAPATGTTTGSTITVSPRPVNYDFTVTTPVIPPPPLQDPPLPTFSAIAGATVTISPAPVTAPPATSATGTTRGVVNENVAFTWTVKKTGFLTRYGSFPKATSLADVPVTVSMVAGVSGRVRDGASGVNSAAVVVCPSDSTTACTPAESDRSVSSTTSEGVFTIKSDLLPGSYKVWATAPGGAKTGSSSLTIAANGNATLSPSDIAIIAIP